MWKKKKIARVKRSKRIAQRSYDFQSMFYSISDFFEKVYKQDALLLLSAKSGERVLEVGFGTGWALKKIKQSGAMVFGCDISMRMARRAKKAVGENVLVVCDAARALPFKTSSVDSIFMSFVLELFDTPEIPTFLKEVKRVLKKNGRFTCLSLSREGEGVFVRAYEEVRKPLQFILDCRPIYLKETLKGEGFKIISWKVRSDFLFPVEIAVAGK